MHEFKVGEYARVLSPFNLDFPGIYEVVVVTTYDDPDTPKGVIDQTVSLDINSGPDYAPRDFANKYLELAENA